MSGNSITITGSTVGAIAVGNGATASSNLGASPDAPTAPMRFTFEARGATKAQIARWLRAAADAVEGDFAPVFAKTEGKTSRAWTLGPETSDT